MSLEHGAAHRLVAYGTLVPGASNHDVVAPLGGQWEPATITGRVEWLTAEIPRLAWHPDGPPVAAWLLTTPTLVSAWSELDRFEGEAYARRVVPVRVHAGTVLARCYVHPASPLLADSSWRSPPDPRG